MAILKPHPFLAFWQLVRWPNLLMMALSLNLIRFALFVPLQIPMVLSHWHFQLLVLSTVLIGMAGYVVNDLYDIQNDLINKPHKVLIGKVFSQRFAWNAFYICFLSGAILGYYLGQHTGKWMYGLINLITGFWLYLYAADFKGRPVLGNVIISFLSAGVLTYPIFFDVLPRLPLPETDAGLQVAQVLLVYFLFAFGLSWAREMVKDLEDREGDNRVGLKTLPIVWGETYTRWLALALSVVLMAALAFIGFYLWPQDLLSALYVVLGILLPLILATFKLALASTNKQYHQVATWHKISMLGAILSIPIFTLSALYL